MASTSKARYFLEPSLVKAPFGVVRGRSALPQHLIIGLPEVKSVCPIHCCILPSQGLQNSTPCGILTFKEKWADD
jgi:hypothetical protein